jgi:hypothetical protein
MSRRSVHATVPFRMERFSLVISNMAPVSEPISLRLLGSSGRSLGRSVADAGQSVEMSSWKMIEKCRASNIS